MYKNRVWGSIKPLTEDTFHLLLLLLYPLCWHLLKKIRLIWSVCGRDRVNSLLSSKYFKAFVSAPRNPQSSAVCWCVPFCLGQTSAAAIPLLKDTSEQSTHSSKLKFCTVSRHCLYLKGGPDWFPCGLMLHGGAVRAQPVPWVRRYRRGGAELRPLLGRELCWRWEVSCLLTAAACARAILGQNVGLPCPACPDFWGPSWLPQSHHFTWDVPRK